MFNIPPSLPPTQYIVQGEAPSQDALSEYAIRNNLYFENINKEIKHNDQFEKSVKLIAHKGYSSIAPENTIPAFIEAAKHGYKIVECDISWTKDSVPVLLHDSTINRTAVHNNGLPVIFPKLCSNMTYEELLKYDFGLKKGEKFRGTKIPTFEQFLQCCKENDLSPYIELKQNDSVDEDKIKMLVGMVNDYNLSEKVTWISFNSDYLQTVSKFAPKARLGYLSSKTPDKKVVETLKSLQTGENEVFLDVKASKLTQSSSALVKQNGFDIEAWTVDDRNILNKLYAFDCAAITTNGLTEDMIGEYYDTFTKSN